MQNHHPGSPAHPTPHDPKSPEMRAYWAALGEFIDKFAWVEFVLTMALIFRAGFTSVQAGRAAFGDVRVANAISAIKRLLLATKADAELVAAYDRILDQLGQINGARNDIAHYGMSFDAAGEPEVKNAFAFFADPKARRRPMPPETLSDMTADLDLIMMQLIGLMALSAGVPGFGPELGTPWRYKPPALAAHPQTPRARS